MIVAPTTTVDVQAPVYGEDEYGDPVVHWHYVATFQPGHIAERRRRVWDPTSSRTATVTWEEAILPPGLDVRKGYRLYDHSTDRYLHVTHVRRPTNPAFPGASLLVELEDPAG